MSSHLHKHFIRAHRRAATAAAGVILASASVACASAANPAHLSVARATPSVLRVGVTSRAVLARMDELKAQGYVQTACTVSGALMFNPHTHRTVVVPA